ncbi:MAG: hypothetical protein ACUVQ8_08090 [Nitrososphaeria archaeon]
MSTETHVLPATVDSPLYRSSEIQECASFVDLTATLSEDEKTLYFHIVNRHEKEAVELQTAFRSFRPKKGSMQFVAGDSVEDIFYAIWQDKS